MLNTWLIYTIKIKSCNDANFCFSFPCCFPYVLCKPYNFSLHFSGWVVITGCGSISILGINQVLDKL